MAEVIIEDSDKELQLGFHSNTGNPLFADCPLDYVYIGRNINYNTTQSYGYSPFYNSKSLRAVNIADKETEISENEFYGCTNLQKVTMGDGITTIGIRAFSGCSSLSEFAFGSKVKTIGQEAFSDCHAMTKFSSKAITPPVCGSQALDDINKWECTLYVPSVSLGAYQAADQWKEFLLIEQVQESSSSITGDANGDGKVNEADINAISSHIIGKTPADFDANLADVNKDGKVDAADIVVLVNMIRNK